MNANICVAQLQKLSETMTEERSPSTRQCSANVARMTRQKLQELEWEVLPYPPFSPNLAPPEYRPFRTLM